MKHTLETKFIHKGVDRTTRTILGVSVATIGEARGHGLHVDAKTLDQLKECALKYDNGVKVKADHGSGVLSTVGFLKNFQIDGDQLRADFEIFASEKDGEKLFDMAEKIPDTFGLSVNFSGEDQKIGTMTFARCSELFSADIVTEPAANKKGLFSVKDEDPSVKKIASLGEAVVGATRGFGLAASRFALKQFGGPGSGPRKGGGSSKEIHPDVKASLEHPRHQEIRKDYENLKSKSAKEVQMILYGQSKVTSKSDNGKESDISTILANRHGRMHVGQALSEPVWREYKRRQKESQ